MAITLVNINPQNVLEEGIKPLLYSMKWNGFDKALLLTPKKPENLPEGIEWKEIPPMNLNGYNKFMIKYFYLFIETSHCITIQGDGFISHPENWNNDFLNYDYIGAPWTDSDHYSHVRVGNGGFSLRSKKFLEACKHLNPSGFNEDHELCISYRPYMLKYGIKFAPVEVAAKFSKESEIEIPTSYEECFGFHGNKEMAKELLQKI